MEKLNETAFAQQLKAFFPVGVTAGELRHTRHSFWSGNEEHDVRFPQSADGRTRSGFDRISPQSVELDLDRVVMTREYIMLLLGGLTNMWSNVICGQLWHNGARPASCAPHRGWRSGP